MTAIEKFGYIQGYLRKQADMMQENTSGSRTQAGDDPGPLKNDTNKVFMKQPEIEKKKLTGAELKAANERFDDAEHEHMPA